VFRHELPGKCFGVLRTHDDYTLARTTWALTWVSVLRTAQGPRQWSIKLDPTFWRILFIVESITYGSERIYLV
jgi:hypothetical protein